MKAKSLIIFLSCIFCSIVQAEIYKWVDENGKTHISDKPPAEETQSMETLKKEDVKINAVSEGQDSKDRRAKYLKGVYAEQQRTAEEKAKQAKNQKNVNSACKDMKIELNNLNSGLRLYHVDEKGEHQFMSDEDRDAKNARLSSTYQEKCQTYQNTLNQN